MHNRRTGVTINDHLDLLPHTAALPEAPYISRADIQYSIDAFRAVLRTATAYREQLAKTSQDASNFAQALEQLARTDTGNDGVGPGLQAFAGFHYLISNQNQILSDAVHKTFEWPLEGHCKDYEAKLKGDEMEYEQTIAVLGESIRRTEARSTNLGRRGQRDLNTFRSAIADLTRQVDDLESIKETYYEGVHNTKSLCLGLVLQSAGAVVRAEVDVYQKIAHKGITEPILEGMISSVLEVADRDERRSSEFSNCSDSYKHHTVADRDERRSSEFSNGSDSYKRNTLVDRDERRSSEFSNGSDSYKHNTGTMNAFAALFGATVTEVWAGQEEETDEDEEEVEEVVEEEEVEESEENDDEEKREDDVEEGEGGEADGDEVREGDDVEIREEEVDEVREEVEDPALLDDDGRIAVPPSSFVETEVTHQ